jgi:hypothetical protein
MRKDPIIHLTDTNTSLDSRLLRQDCPDPDPEEIIRFLDEIHDFGQVTFDSEHFKLALSLLQKWKVILMSFYNQNYRKSISRLPNDFSLERRYGLTDEDIKEIDGELSQNPSILGGWWRLDNQSNKKTPQEQLTKKNKDKVSQDSSIFEASSGLASKSDEIISQEQLRDEKNGVNILNSPFFPSKSPPKQSNRHLQKPRFHPDATRV